ncbi:MAG: type IV pilus modification protein PilV [Methylococcales bacterium]
MKTHSGFTLIEVLIAMLILAGGLLGLAALQTYTLRSNLAAYNYGQATQLLYDMSDRMRANNCKVTCLNPVNYLIPDTFTDVRTKDKTVVSSPAPVSPITLATAAACRPTTPTATTATTCNATLLSTYDLIEWNTAIAATLPLGRACITSANGIFNLYITWDDDRSGTVTTDVALPTGCTFSTYVAPASGTVADPIFTVSLQL